MTKEQKTAFIAELEAMKMPERHKFLAEMIHQESDPAILKEKLVAIFDNFNFSISRDLFVETDGNHEAIADLIIKNKVEASKSDDRDNPGMVLRFAFENPEREHLFETDSELLDRAIENVSMKRKPGFAFIEPFAPCTKGHERHIPHNQDN